MKFNKEILQELACMSEGEQLDYADGDGTEPTLRAREFTVLLNEQIDNSRWAIQFNMVFNYDYRCWQTSYQIGATEQQDESPYEYDDNEVECNEVYPHETVVIKYSRTK